MNERITLQNKGHRAIKGGPDAVLNTPAGPDRNPSSNPRTTTLISHKAGEAPVQDVALKSVGDWRPVGLLAASLLAAARKRCEAKNGQ